MGMDGGVVNEGVRERGGTEVDGVDSRFPSTKSTPSTNVTPPQSPYNL